mmetsp:Transcript_2929/g.6408  ORF Transcript_2929/g.6408 Transcript_2929/m.6408 type:complete len:118 (+) Transcript_2929:664-1017(+)
MLTWNYTVITSFNILHLSIWGSCFVAARSMQHNPMHIPITQHAFAYCNLALTCTSFNLTHSLTHTHTHTRATFIPDQNASAEQKASHDNTTTTSNFFRNHPKCAAGIHPLCIVLHSW